MCDKTPTFAQLPALPCCCCCCTSPRSVCASASLTIIGITCILCYRKTSAYLIAGRLCHSAALAKSQPATHAFFLSRSERPRRGRDSGNMAVLTQSGVQGAEPCAHAPVCQPDTCPMPTQAHTAPSFVFAIRAIIFLFPSLRPPVRIMAVLSGILPSPVATGLSPTPPPLPIRLHVC